MESTAKPRLANPLPVASFVYFIYYAGFGIYMPFIYIYYRHVGMSGLQIGIINTLSPLVGLLSAPLWGLLNDRYGKTRLMLCAAITGATLSAWGIALSKGFPALLVTSGLFSLFYSMIVPMLDSNTLLLLGTHRERYGSIRLWGSLGYVLLTLTGGIALERLGMDWLFPIFSMCMFFFLIAIFWYPTRRVSLNSSPRIFELLLRMLRQPHWLVFFLSVVLMWIAANGMHTFLGVYMKEMNASEGLIGLTMSLGGLSEVPVMFLGARLLKRLAPRKMLALAMLAYGVRMLLYGIMPSPTWAPFIQLMNSVTFGFFWLGSIAYVNELAPDEIKATSQGLLLAILNLAVLISSSFTGWVYDTAGPANLFLLLGGSSLLAMILFVVGTLRIRKTSPG